MMLSGMKNLLGRIAVWPKRRWATVGGCMSVLVGLAVGMGVYGLWARFVAGAVILGILAAAFTLVVAFLVYLQVGQWQRGQAIQALVNVRPLTGRLPVDLGDWAADPVFADEVVRSVCRRQPRRIVECGSGWTTVLMAACLEELGGGTLVAMEHDEGFARRTRHLLAACGCSERADVRLAPLGSHDLAEADRLWYDPGVVEQIEGPIDLLVVDGPPGPLGSEIRWPAVPVLCHRLAEDCVVYLDDGLRDDEARIARSWGRELGVRPKLDPRGGGFWILDRADDEAGKEEGPPA